MTNQVGPPRILPDGFDNKYGALFFGIDATYLAEVQKKEIFYLIGYGFDYTSLTKMPVDERRYFFHLWIDKMEKENNANKV